MKEISNNCFTKLLNFEGFQVVVELSQKVDYLRDIWNFFFFFKRKKKKSPNSYRNCKLVKLPSSVGISPEI